MKDLLLFRLHCRHAAMHCSSTRKLFIKLWALPHSARKFVVLFLKICWKRSNFFSEKNIFFGGYWTMFFERRENGFKKPNRYNRCPGNLSKWKMKIYFGSKMKKEFFQCWDVQKLRGVVAQTRFKSPMCTAVQGQLTFSLPSLAICSQGGRNNFVQWQQKMAIFCPKATLWPKESCSAHLSAEGARPRSCAPKAFALSRALTICSSSLEGHQKHHLRKLSTLHDSASKFLELLWKGFP